MSNRVWCRVAVLGVLGAMSVLAQDAPLSGNAIQIQLPNDAPVVLLGINTGPSRVSARGAALVLDLNLSLTLKNTSANRIHGVMLRVVSQEVAFGGVATVFQPSLNIAPGEAFPVRIKAQLWRPAQVAAGPMVQVNLEGVLFQDLSFYGENKLDSRRVMTAAEMEAQRDREFLKDVFRREGAAGLKAAMVQIVAKQGSAPKLTGSVRNGGASNMGLAMAVPERQAQFAMLRFPDAPVEPIQGTAAVAAGEIRATNIRVKNAASRPVKHVEMTLVVTDASGREFVAGSVPSANGGFLLPMGGQADVRADRTFSFTNGSQPLSIQKLTSYVSQVEFEDGKLWIPNRQDLSNPLLTRVVPPSAEEQRLADLYLNKGPEEVARDLSRY